MADRGREPGTSGPETTHPVGDVLRERRRSLRLTGKQLAELAGMTPSKVSRVETGRTGVTPADVRRLAEALRMSESEIDELAQHAGATRPATEPMEQWGTRSGGLTRRQAEVAEAEQAAREISIFQPAVVPGLLQTSGYAEAVMRPRRRPGNEPESETAEADLIDAVAARVRRQRILKIPDKRFRFIMTESTLSNRLGSPEDMVAQVRRIREIARLPNVSIAIIPADAALARAPMNGFELLDDEWVMMDLFNTSLRSQVISDIQLYQDVFEGFAEVAETAIEPFLDRYAAVYLSRAASH